MNLNANFTPPQKITVIGGGPGGLYFSILTKKVFPNCQIDIYERNKADDSFGFGVVFSDETLGEFLTRDTKSYDLIRSKFAYWDDIVVARNGENVSISGNGFCGCSRKTLLQLLQQRCREEGVNLYFEHNIEDLSQLQDSDYIIACDGINSAIREQFTADFGTKIELKKNKFVWLGSTKPLDAFTYFFRTTPHGTLVAHSYQYEEGMSTWIFECAPETWEKLGFETTNEKETIKILSEIFSEELDGHPLISNRSHWRQFPAVTNKNWHKDNIVLLGDAKATAHYSIGSGTKLAMECAIALSDAIVKFGTNKEAAFAEYEKSRRNRVEMIQYAANVSLDWFENMDRYINFDFQQFAFGVMTRSKKVTFENLALRDTSFPDKVLTEFNIKNKISNLKTPAAFTPFQIKNLKLENRIVMAPMGQYQAENGLPNSWHFSHYTQRALGGLGLIITEMTAVNSFGRITLGCTGIYNENQAFEWKKINDFIHQNSICKIAIQLGHSGRKGSLKKPWETEKLADSEQWELIAASSIAYSENGIVPKEMTISDMDSVVKDFENAAINAEKAGFDMIELQAHHGFLLASFLSPLTNIRSDEFGGTIENRLKFPLRVFTAVRNNFPSEKPISVRISATDWAENGVSPQEVLTIAEAFKNAGADIINVSTGNTVAYQNPQMGRMWQTPFSDFIRNQSNIPTITAGSITDIDQINTIILNGKADLVALGKPLLLNPYFVRNAQAYENFEPNDVPNSYKMGVSSLFSEEKSKRKMTEEMKKALKPKSHK
ncbi:FAD-dependent monooxygenase [Flavobacterium sp.]|uniref:oxidoreductase n=1 Tax=Flavobacterium sp. TaxID=239 RepID=UPI002636F5B0|nr:FAD-dependent monooxygenase [Flavobacterium sp.]MDD3005013.1 FAD-dependent monooxygenase [Flavobacterium sp.]